MSKRIVLLTQFFPPETGAGANRIGPMADVLSKYYDVLVVTLKPSYPSPHEHKGISLKAHDARYPYVAKRTFGFYPHKGSLLLRTLREQLMALRLALRVLPESADILVTSSPSMFLGPVGLAVARAKKAKFAWDVRDITWGYARDVAGPSPVMTFATRLLEKYILFALRRADLVVGASQGITRMLIDSGVDAGRTITVANGISADLLGDIVQRTAGKVKNRRPVVAYAGVIGYNQNLGVLLEAARMLPDVDLVLAGDGPELPMLKKKARKLGLGNVSFRGYLDREKLLELYRQSDVLIASVRSSPTIDATMIPIKLFEYMAAGRPIVYAGRGAAAELLCQIGCAVTVDPGDPEAISDAIARLLGDAEQMRNLGLRGRSSVQSDFHRDKLMEQFASALEERSTDAPAHK
jgi:glycosyltransferase involved in cell wall biosynthesis